MVLPDLLNHNLKVVFCGTAAGDKSALRKAYYAGPGNLFYSALSISGLTPKLLKPHEYLELVNYDIGLTDLAKLTHGVDNKLKDEDFDVAGFEKKMLKYQPAVICFNGKEAARVYFRLNSTKSINYGLQRKELNNTKLFVVPSTSSSGRKYWDIDSWHKLAAFIRTY
jgi:TDG/mug DNA glycosylase family protein